jgi:hypothetical protein
MDVVVEREVTKRVVVETQWEESRTKAKPSQENLLIHERSEHQRRKDETHQR